MECSLFIIQSDFYRKLEHTYFYHLRNFIKENNLDGVNTILEKIIIPNQILTYRNLHLASVEILEVILNEKLNFDHVVKQSLESLNCYERNNNNELKVKDLESLTSNVSIKFTDEMYKKYLLTNLFADNEGIVSINNLICKYRNLRYYCDKLICDALYCADNEFVKRCIQVFKALNYEFNFEPLSRISHQNIMAWLINNMRNGAKGKPVGWQSGPDSAHWPSTNTQDYVDVLNLIEPYIRLHI